MYTYAKTLALHLLYLLLLFISSLYIIYALSLSCFTFIFKITKHVYRTICWDFEWLFLYLFFCTRAHTHTNTCITQRNWFHHQSIFNSTSASACVCIVIVNAISVGSEKSTSMATQSNSKLKTRKRRRRRSQTSYINGICRQKTKTVRFSWLPEKQVTGWNTHGCISAGNQTPFYLWIKL